MADLYTRNTLATLFVTKDIYNINMFQAVALLEGHTEDVKDVCVIPQSQLTNSSQTDSIASVSRDGSLRVWTCLSSDQDGEGTDKIFTSKVAFKGKEFLNSVCALDNNKTIFVGGNSGKIYEIDTVFNKVAHELAGHRSNVCTLAQSADHKTLLSGSWDSTVRQWDLATGSDDIEPKSGPGLPHENAVWAIAPLPSQDVFISASADASLRIWSNGKLDLEVKRAHSGPVRGLAVLETVGNNATFASCGNDNIISIWEYSADSKQCSCVGTLVGHTNFVYNIAHVPTRNNDYLVSVSEDRTVRVWDWRNCLLEQTIIMPMVSVWCVAPFDDGFVCGGSDSCLWVFKQGLQETTKTEEVRRVQLSNFTIDRREFESAGVSTTPVPTSQLDTPGQDGQVIVVLDKDSVPSAPPAHAVYVYNSSSWERVGVLDAPVAKTKTINPEDGKSYDYVFDIDADNRMLKLPYNVGDNPFIVATQFQEKYELHKTYVDQIVSFIEQNTQGAVPGTAPPAAAPSTSASQSQVAPKKQLDCTVLPFHDYVKLTAVNSEGLLSTLRKENDQVSAQLQLSSNEIKLIEQLLQQQPPTDTTKTLGAIVTRVHETWPAERRLPVADVMRIISLTSSNPSQYLQPIFSNLSADHPKLGTVSIRAVVNLFSNPKGLPLVTNEEIAGEILGYIESVTDRLPKDKMSQLAVASLVLNYATSPALQKSIDLAAIILRIINAAGRKATDSEPLYRFLLALGTVLYNNRGDEILVLAQSLELQQWAQNVQLDEPRFVTLKHDLSLVFS